MKKRIISLLTALSLTAGTITGALAGTALPAAGEEEAFSYPEIEHENWKPDEIRKKKYDHTRINALLEEWEKLLDKKSADKKDEEEAIRLYEEIMLEYDLLYSEFNYLYIETCQDPQDEKAEQAYDDTLQDMNEIQDAIYLALQKGCTGAYQSVFQAYLPEAYYDSALEYEALDETAKSFIERQTDLENRYWKAAGEEYSFTIDGKKYTWEDLQDIEDEDLYEEVLIGIVQAENAVLAPIYQEVVKLDNEVAEYYGYTDFAAYAYENNFGREYKPEQAREFTRYVKENLLPLYLLLSFAAEELDEDPYELFEDVNQEKRLDLVEPYIREINPELMEAWDFLRNNQLYDMEMSSTKAEQGFTIDFPAWNSAYIYDQPDEGFYAYKTVVHEFGHFNAAYHTEEPSFWYLESYDLAEVQSQGLEMLYLDYWDDLIGDGDLADDMTLKNLLNMLDSVISGCEVNEIEVYAHEHPDQSCEEWNKAFAEILSSYALRGDTEDEYYSWVEINHITTSPFYYISYATSAFSALDIWAEAETDREEAVSDYLELSAMTTVTYQDALEQVGMRKPFAEGDIKALAKILRVKSEQEGWFDKQLWNNILDYLVNNGYIEKGGSEDFSDAGSSTSEWLEEPQEDLDEILDMLQEGTIGEDGLAKLMQIAKISCIYGLSTMLRCLLHPTEVGIHCALLSGILLEIIWPESDLEELAEKLA